MELLRISVATKNRHKVEEANIALKSFGIELVPVDVPKVEIQSDDLREIAIYAARAAYQYLRRPVVVEDSGLFIDALNGFPGPYSSYVYRTIGVEGILKLMRGVEDRRARFVAVVAFALREDWIEVFEGVVEGTIAEEARGSHGFGFDPIFVPFGETRTFAEMSSEEKTRYSHRGRAFRKLGEWIAKNIDKLKPLLQT